MQDIQTKFAPPAAIYYTIRQKRSISDEDDTQALQTYQVKSSMTENIM